MRAGLRSPVTTTPTGPIKTVADIEALKQLRCGSPVPAPNIHHLTHREWLVVISRAANP
jgi:hypothetical protein